jgi:outer membrane protein assembly factor BamB
LATGKPVWSLDLPTQYEIASPPFGIGPTPILEGDLLIVLVGGWPNSGVVAFRADNGKVVWQSVGKETWEGADAGGAGRRPRRGAGREDLISYSSPLCATIRGKRQLLCLMRQGLVSLDPRNGDLNYKFWFSPRNPTSVTAARPVVLEDDRIFLTGSYGAGGTLLEVDPSGRSVKQLWHTGALGSHWSTPIYRDGFIYGFTGREEPAGFLVCVDAKTGKRLWTTRGYDGDDNDLAVNAATGQVKNRKTNKIIPYPYFGRGSLTQAGKRFIILGERGTLALADLSPKGYSEICRASIKGTQDPTWPSPVLAGKRLFIRDAKRIVCLDLAPNPAKP